MLNPDRRASVEGSHHVSPVNFWPETLAGTSFPAQVHLIDSTIRKTNFTAGQATSLAGFVRIAEALAELGVETTCLNVTFGGGTEPVPHEWDLMKAVLDADLPININVWSEVFLGNGRERGRVDPIDALHRFVDAGATTLAPGIVAAPDAEAERRQAEDLQRWLEEALRLGVTPTMTLAGVGMRDFAQMGRMGKFALDHGATRLDFMDSTSSMSPEGTRTFVSHMRELVGADATITMHMHDEFGLATACALAACSAGAHPDVSLNGMSYRCGFAALEEVALSLEVFYGVNTGLNLDRIDHASRVVARESGLPIPHLKPLTGVFAHLKHSAGEAAAAIRTGQDAFPPLSHGLVPARMGSEVSWVWPVPSSDDLTRTLAESCGVILDDDEVRVVRARLDAEVPETFPRWLEPEVAADLLRDTVNQLRGTWTIPSAYLALCKTLPAGPFRDEVLSQVASSGIMLHADIDLERVRTILSNLMETVSTGTLIDLASTFGRFDRDNDGAQPDQSAQEEKRLHQSPVADQDRLAATARAYEEHFGYPPVLPATGMSAQEIDAVLRESFERTPAVELARLRSSMATIFDARLVRMATPSER